MKNKFTIIRLKPHISIIDFEQLNKTNEPIISFEISEINSLTKTSSFTRFPQKKKPIINQIKKLPIFFR